MNKNISVLVGLVIVLLIVMGVIYAARRGGVDREMVGPVSPVSDGGAKSGVPTGETMVAKGSYEAYAPELLARAATGPVVLFFRATWCPTCRALDADIRAHLGQIPSDFTILDVDYDRATKLKQQYGVTYQHTLVQVDQDGNLIKKWSGSPTLAVLVAQVQ